MITYVNKGLLRPNLRRQTLSGFSDASRMLTVKIRVLYFTTPWVILASFRYWNNQTRLTCYIKVPELRVGPQWWPRIQAEKKRTKLRPPEGASTFLCGLPHSTLLTEITVLPLKTN